MKKLFYSFFMLAAMSLTFVACEQKEPEQKEEEPKVESNCNLDYFETTTTDFGQVYLIGITTNDVVLTDNGFQGTGDYLSLQMYAKPQEDLFPVENSYKAYSIEEMDENFAEEEFVMGGTVFEGYPAGTFIATIEDGENTDILFCIGGTVKFEGNATDGVITANLDFESFLTGETFEKEFIFAGAIDIEVMKSYAPKNIKFIKQ